MNLSKVLSKEIKKSRDKTKKKVDEKKVALTIKKLDGESNAADVIVNDLNEQRAVDTNHEEKPNSQDDQKKEEQHDQKQVQDNQKKQEKAQRYALQYEKEAAVDRTFQLEDISNHNKHKLETQIRVFIKEVVKSWENSGENADILYDTKKNLVLLLYKLRSDGLTDDMVISLGTICYYIQNKEWKNALESYMKLSIGNLAWPIGVISVGIHERSADLKITGENTGANIMIDDKTRRWITAVKRLITYSERKL